MVSHQKGSRWVVWCLGALAVLAAGAAGLAAVNQSVLHAGEPKHGKDDRGGKGAAMTGTVQQLVLTGQTAKAETLKTEKKSLKYQSLSDKDGKKTGYLFTNEELNSKIKGYNGPITLAVRTDLAGKAEDFVILKHTETPRYLMRVLAEKAKFLNKTIIPASKPKADVVSGATYSSTAISESLYEIGAEFSGVLQPAKK